MIRRKKVSYFIDAKESTTVLDLKKIIRGITKQPIDDMKLYKDDLVRDIVFISIDCVLNFNVVNLSFCKWLNNHKKMN